MTDCDTPLPHYPPVEFDGVAYEPREEIGVGGCGVVARYARVDHVNHSDQTGDIAVKFLSNHIKLELGPFILEAFAIFSSMRAELVALGLADVLSCDGDRVISELVPGLPLWSDVAPSLLQNMLTVPDIHAALKRSAVIIGGLMERGLLHGDIKPHNMIATYDAIDRLRLVDIDFFRRPDRRGGLVIGTPYYLPPEACKSSSDSLTHDVFSLGVTGINLLSVSIFPGADAIFAYPRETGPYEILGSKCSGRWLNASAWPSVHDGLKRVIPPDHHLRLTQVLDFCKACLVADPAARPQSGAEMHQILTSEPNRTEI